MAATPEESKSKKSVRSSNGGSFQLSNRSKTVSKLSLGGNSLWGRNSSLVTDGELASVVEEEEESKSKAGGEQVS